MVIFAKKGWPLAIYSVLLQRGLAGGAGADVAPEAQEQGPPAALWGPPSEHDDKVYINITNKCGDSVWPGILTQAGTGPGVGGFQLVEHTSRQLSVSHDWSGRIWARTSCLTYGDKLECKTGDCGNAMDCKTSGAIPATLAEFTLDGVNSETFYDISLVDGYNIPLGINHIRTEKQPYLSPDITNCACVANPEHLMRPNEGIKSITSGRPGSAKKTYTPKVYSNKEVDEISTGFWKYLGKNNANDFGGKESNASMTPCLSACAATQKQEDCCSGDFDTTDTCTPSEYSKSAKIFCPDAYSYAFDDARSTFTVGKGGAWEVVFCPDGRSTSIREQLRTELHENGMSLAELLGMDEHNLPPGAASLLDSIASGLDEQDPTSDLGRRDLTPTNNNNNNNNNVMKLHGHQEWYREVVSSERSRKGLDTENVNMANTLDWTRAARRWRQMRGQPPESKGEEGDLAKIPSHHYTAHADIYNSSELGYPNLVVDHNGRLILISTRDRAAQPSTNDGEAKNPSPWVVFGAFFIALLTLIAM